MYDNETDYNRVSVIIQELQDSTENALYKAQEVIVSLKKTSICQKEIRFITNAIKGLIDGEAEFTEIEFEVEKKKIIIKFQEILLNLVDYQRARVFRAPLGKFYLDLKPAHFLSLAKFQGYSKVLQNLINLKMEDPDKVDWCDKRIECLIEHRDNTQCKGSFKEQLNDFINLNCNLEKQNKVLKDRILSEKTERLLKNFKYLKENLDIKDKTGIVVSPAVLQGFFTKISLKELRQAGYKIDIFSTNYLLVHNAKIFGVHYSLITPKYKVGDRVRIESREGIISKIFDKGLTAQIVFDQCSERHLIHSIKVIGKTYDTQGLQKELRAMFDKRYGDSMHLVGNSPVLKEDYYYWMYLENSFKTLNIKTWGLP